MDRIKDRRGDRCSGLGLLLDSKGGRWPDFDALGPRLKKVTEHPFGFSLPEHIGHGAAYILPCRGSDDSVKDMATCIRCYAAGHGKSSGVQRLRIFTVRQVSDMAERRYLFEVQFTNMMFIGGDCTYFSGGGGSATQQLRGIFLALSSIYDIDVEEEVVMMESLVNLSDSVLEDLGLRMEMRQLKKAS
ncbi:hypothetical protein A2763_03235 [Candidatus Kaiserbacteria bacterium RIFCSPHIGHO2_01_FULL_54_36]|uniref:Uncharacterized protein n=1 Tax=Candidatus Kaiserbacteria bacterium RIFCSPHIGHO2_01_FULL_54_36 TaxID=1798482 RepID=A0A1F6CKS7_9BACT|nr:MAG: hypothetical protein A2763_03235 [Candidatus Kaiserbacteria bacterium RIFCSPHIGHO2_01_FULL_54_36]OGG75412.1 MAG: hypothetical protein A3A41_02490 [Candidatus Kaiserbacteria bacterium RIFCSPLOWO2_01_FULL_54_22]